MLLKALVQLFAEKFLQSKKGWVADQSTISLQDSTQLSVITDGKSHPFTMPYTGSLTQEVMEFGLRYWRVQPYQSWAVCEWEPFYLGLRQKKVKNSPTQLGNQTSSLLPIFVYTKVEGNN